jgi:hypothetical protein
MPVFCMCGRGEFYHFQTEFRPSISFVCADAQKGMAFAMSTLTTERDDMSSLAAYAQPITFAKSPIAAVTPSISSSRSSRYDPTLGEPYNMVASEQAIWRAVIVQTLMDASSNSKKKEKGLA